jgi:hypothetical protein
MMNTAIIANMNDELTGVEMAFAHWRGQNRQRCPKCASIIYSRKSHLCGVCGIALPKSFLFNETERAVVTTLLSEERERHRAWLSRREPMVRRGCVVRA